MHGVKIDPNLNLRSVRLIQTIIAVDSVDIAVDSVLGLSLSFDENKPVERQRLSALDTKC